jgi:hypothetical protein
VLCRCIFPLSILSGDGYRIAAEPGPRNDATQRKIQPQPTKPLPVLIPNSNCFTQRTNSGIDWRFGAEGARRSMRVRTRERARLSPPPSDRAPAQKAYHFLRAPAEFHYARQIPARGGQFKRPCNPRPETESSSFLTPSPLVIYPGSFP